jgi:hypothetical protein
LLAELVRAQATEPDGRLTMSQYNDIQEKLFTPSPTFQFEGTRQPVRLRMMQTVPPYVGVDSGSGANAVFDPTTMVCIYSD